MNSRIFIVVLSIVAGTVAVFYFLAWLQENQNQKNYTQGNKAIVNNSPEEIITGGHYLINLRSDKNDPFEKPIIDSIYIVTQLNGYVLVSLKQFNYDLNKTISIKKEFLLQILNSCR